MLSKKKFARLGRAAFKSVSYIPGYLCSVIAPLQDPQRYGILAQIRLPQVVGLLMTMRLFTWLAGFALSQPATLLLNSVTWSSAAL